LTCVSSIRCIGDIAGPEMVYSDDAGITWHRTGDAIYPPGTDGLPISCPTSTWCMAAGANATLTQSKFYVTTNAGVSWNKISAPVSAPPYQIACYRKGHCIVEDDLGELALPPSLTTTIYRTADGGQSWDRNPSTLPDAAGILTCSPGGPTCVDLGSKGKVYVSHDDGEDWDVISVGAGFANNSVTCPSSGTCYATEALTHYPIFKTLDGGEVWRQVS
jgi:photosystem II stability/assembly factor-like uncharacterized protein